MADNPFLVVDPPNYSVGLINFGANKQQPQQQQQGSLAQQLSSFMQPNSAQQQQQQGSAPVGYATAKYSQPSSEIESYIRQAAASRGIDPDIAVRVAKSEGLYSYTGDAGSSFGPFQLHYGGVAGGGNSVGGLGDTFTKTTGLNARDPSTVKQQIDFSLDQASKGGWGPWHGWTGAPFAGITRGNVESGLY